MNINNSKYIFYAFNKKWKSIRECCKYYEVRYGSVMSYKRIHKCTAEEAIAYCRNLKKLGIFYFKKEGRVMKYIIIGAGGTGGILGFYMTKAGKDVTLIARNAHLEAMQKQGLSVEKMWTNETETIPVGAESMESYEAKGEKADVILVCVKKYSLDSCIPFIQNISHKNPHHEAFLRSGPMLYRGR